MTPSTDSTSPLKILVTGGSGFLGKAIVEAFLEQDAPIQVSRLIVYDLKTYAEITDPRLTYIQGDVRDEEALTRACAGIDMVIHAAAIVDWGTKLPAEVYETNYMGTVHVVNACKQCQVPMLIYSSSLDTVITGRPLKDIDERQPYPAKHLNMYCESKCLAEQLVLASQSDTLRTTVLRPSDIYGEGDPFHLPPLIAMAKSGFYVRIGNGTARSQHVYVRNMAWAHVLVAKALTDRNTKVEGQAYFITDGPGANFFTFFDEIVLKSGYRIWPRNLWLPVWFAYSLGVLSETIARIVRPIKYYNPKLSRFAVMYTSTEFTFTAEKARRDFGYMPRYSHEEAMARTIRFFHKDSYQV